MDQLIAAELPADILPPIVPKKHYFINPKVEYALVKYAWTGCTSVALRDQVMFHANELIRQIIRKQNLHMICPGHDESTFHDLATIAWNQIERVLYKFRAKAYCRSCYNPDRPQDSALIHQPEDSYGIATMPEVVAATKGRCPHCDATIAASPILPATEEVYGGSESILYRGVSKVFNLWSQVARTVCLAHIKREGRDKKNAVSYQNHLLNRRRPASEAAVRFITEVRYVCRHHEDYLVATDALEAVLAGDQRPHDSLVAKLTLATKLPKTTVAAYLRFLRLHAHEFTDAPLNQRVERRHRGDDREEEDE